MTNRSSPGTALNVRKKWIPVARQVTTALNYFLLRLPSDEPYKSGRGYQFFVFVQKNVGTVPYNYWDNNHNTLVRLKRVQQVRYSVQSEDNKARDPNKKCFKFSSLYVAD